jgi:hypothetical protein
VEQLDFECVGVERERQGEERERERERRALSIPDRTHFFFFLSFRPRKRKRHTDSQRYALWFLLQLLTSPRTAHRHISYHRQSKGRWARDDPSFSLLVAGVSLGGALAHAAALAPGVGAAVRGTVLAVVAGFLGSGLVVSVVGWSLANGALASSGPGGGGGGGSGESETRTTTGAAGAPTSSSSSSSSSFSSSADASEPVELAYCFDVHANAFSAVALVLFCGQVLLLPLLLARPKSSLSLFASSLLSNALVAASAAAYWYLAFLGYAALPSVGPRRAQLALWPAIALVGLSPVAALARVNPSRLVLGLLFGDK